MTKLAELKSSNSSRSRWRQLVVEYARSDTKRAIWQLVSSIGFYLAVWLLIPLAMKVSYWLVVPLVLLGAGLLVRVFITMHDCGHGSFFRSKRANDFWGYIAGVLVFTPYRKWTREHAIHHGAAGNLDKRGTGDVWTMTVREYVNSGFWKRMGYKAFRHPLYLFVAAPFLLFVISYRFVSHKAPRIDRVSTRMNNLGIAVVWLIGSSSVGLLTFSLIMVPMVWLAAIGGVWLFYVQHQFEETYWEEQNQWDFVQGALQGSSFYQLPKVLQWFSGNIGFHHIHHLSPRIPNYFLEKCHQSIPQFAEVKPLTLWRSFKTMTLRLWDEEKKQMVSFRQFRRLKRAGALA